MAHAIVSIDGITYDRGSRDIAKGYCRYSSGSGLGLLLAVLFDLPRPQQNMNRFRIDVPGI